MAYWGFCYLKSDPSFVAIAIARQSAKWHPGGQFYASIVGQFWSLSLRFSPVPSVIV